MADVEKNALLPRKSLGVSLPEPKPSADVFINLANRVYFSKLYTCLYLLVIVLNTFAIIWTLRSPKGYPSEVWFIIIEIFINITILGEVALRMVTQRRKYWTSCSNIFDVFVMALCITALILYLRGPSTEEEVEDIAADFMVAFRNGIQYLRLIMFLKNRGKNKPPVDNIDFSPWDKTKSYQQEASFVYEEDKSPSIHIVSANGKISRPVEALR
eukprot:GILK01004307.1.p1 GENE.GILK01004307.1~~GILK01004307.1.p1  ORF type:complete len:230 (-),score=41.52 GILK01004307.1:174-815(-)